MVQLLKHLDRRSEPLCSTIYMKFDNHKVDNSLKATKLHGQLKECVPSTARANSFPLKKGKSTVIAERKKNYVILGDVITVHKSQGSTLAYMQVYLSCFTGKKTAMGKNYQQPISQGQFYTFLSWAKIHDKVLFLNFEAEDTKVNESRGDVLNEEWVLATPLNRTEWY